MLVRKPKKGPVSDSDRPRALTASSGLAPWSMVWIVLRQRKRKIRPLPGVKGLAHWAASPFGGERGSPSQFPRQLNKLGRDFYRAQKTEENFNAILLWKRPCSSQKCVSVVGK